VAYAHLHMANPGHPGRIQRLQPLLHYSPPAASLRVRIYFAKTPLLSFLSQRQDLPSPGSVVTASRVHGNASIDRRSPPPPPAPSPDAVAVDSGDFNRRLLHRRQLAAGRKGAAAWQRGHHHALDAVSGRGRDRGRRRRRLGLHLSSRSAVVLSLAHSIVEFQ
jgi:hypothetical protein